MYQCKQKYLHEGEMLLRELDDTDSLFIIESGQLEIFIEVEGNPFVVEHLNAGSILNHHVVFTEDQMITNIRATMPTYYLELHEKDFEFLQ